MLRALAASAGVLTILPVGQPVGQRAAPRWAVLGLAPVVGMALAGLEAGLFLFARWLFPGAPGALLASVLALAALAGATRGLHLDGLADTADGLGRFAGPAQSLAVMRRGDVGPFGVITVLLVLLVDVAALTRDGLAGRGAASLALAVVCGRLAMLQAGVSAAPARLEGLGASVARSVPLWWAVIATTLLIAAGLAPWAFGNPGLAFRLTGAVLAGLAAGSWLRRRARRRLGGITGDVLGAVCEVATAVALLVTAVR